MKDGGLGLVRNPADASQGPRVEEKETPVFEPDEARRFAAAVAGKRLEALYVVALALGLRQGELLGLRWQDVDLDGRVLHVRQQLQRSDGRLQLVPLKTRKSRRSLPMPGFVAEALTAHRDRQDSEGLVNVMGLVFVSEVGQPVDCRNLLRKFKAHLRRAGLADRSFHALRHSAATFLLLQGVEMKVVQEILGHSNLGTTEDRYSHVLDRMKREAVDRLNGLWIVGR